MSDLITDLDTITIRAKQQFNDFQVMRYMLEAMTQLSDLELDALVDELARPIIEAIDCTECANCCRSLDVYLTPDDAKQIADGIDVPLHHIMTRHINLEDAKSEDEWGKFKAKPCAFLDQNLCRIYSHRPETCRTYPQFTPDFRWVLDDIIDGAHICPIIYNVLNQMISVTNELSRRSA